MKRRMLYLTTIILFIFVLSSCDHPEKSFQAMNRDAIPNEVTRNFQLEIGVYAPFIWTSDHDAIVIRGNEAVVHQQVEDVIVNLTATIHQKSESFAIKVLKIGSPLSNREKAEDITIYLNDTFTEIDGDLLALPNEMNGIYIKYHLDLLQSTYGYKIDQENTYLSSSFRALGNSFTISMSFHTNQEMTDDHQVYQSYLTLVAKPLSEDDPFLLAVQEINIHNYPLTSNLKYQFGITNLKVGDVIEFGTSPSFEVNFTINRPEYFLKKASNQYEIIHDFRDKTSELGRITITIGGVSKTIFVHMHM